MGSQLKTYKAEKLTGKVYTPLYIINKILDDVEYNSEAILGKKILDPACGDGRFLVEVARRIIEFSKEEDLKQNLEMLYGWDIDSEAIDLCKINLNRLVGNLGVNIKWNVFATNSLEKYNNNLFLTDEKISFDFIVGNPPYIRIQHLEDDLRIFIQKNYSFCQSGSTDIFIAFFELSYNLLANNGVCGLITPNSYFSTETARHLRSFFSSKQIIKQITNFGNIQLFDNATTYSAITIFSKKRNNRFIYQQAESIDKFIQKEITFADIKYSKFWQLSVNNIQPLKGIKLKDLCNIHVGITTLSDKIYIFPVETIDDTFVKAFPKGRPSVVIEKAILKPIVKGSTLKHRDEEIKEYILFPFKKVNEKNIILSEEELNRLFPNAYNYLLSIKEELGKRDNGKPIKPWFNFGRTQSLDNSFGKKIIFSPMNKEPNFILYENEEATLYSGYCIKYKGDYDNLLSILNSKEMKDYISISSRDFRGGWKAYNKRILEEFVISSLQ
jgi:predicted RNA methylase